MGNDSRQGMALVTGGARRIGAALVRALARLGYPVAIHHMRSGNAASSLVKEIAAGGGEARAFSADLRSDEAAQQLLRTATQQLGPCTILVNNASHFAHDTLLTGTRTSWDDHLELNLRAPLVLSRVFADLLPAATSGLIVNLLDPRVWTVTPHYLSYSVSRAGLWAATRILALELAPRIRVNAIGPGPTLSSESEGEAGFRATRNRLPLSPGPSPEDISDALIYLVSAKSVTGQMIAPDGGQHLGWLHPARDEPIRG